MSRRSAWARGGCRRRNRRCDAMRRWAGQGRPADPGRSRRVHRRASSCRVCRAPPRPDSVRPEVSKGERMEGLRYLSPNGSGEYKGRVPKPGSACPNPFALSLSKGLVMPRPVEPRLDQTPFALRYRRARAWRASIPQPERGGIPFALRLWKCMRARGLRQAQPEREGEYKGRVPKRRSACPNPFALSLSKGLVALHLIERGLKRTPFALRYRRARAWKGFDTYLSPNGKESRSH